MKIMTLLSLACAGWLLFNVPAAAQDAPKEQKEMIAKGLAWLAKAQHKDGHWEGHAGQYPSVMTALASMALLAEGSTPLEGKYKDELDRAVNWLMTNRRKDGLLCSTHKSEEGLYMYSHGFALLCLAHVFDRCEPRKDKLELLDRFKKVLRKDLARVMAEAVAFSVKAQSSVGGWYYTSAAEGVDADELHQTALQFHALATVRADGIHVPNAVMDRAQTYLERAIPVTRGNPFKREPISPQPPAVAAALAAILYDGNLDSPLVKNWLPHCPKDASGIKMFDLEPYFHCHYAQVMHRLGDKGYAKLFPDSKEPLTWSAYRKVLFEKATQRQEKDGSWPNQFGAVFGTANLLIALQVENGHFLLTPPGGKDKPR